jgi:hypothetical protein
MNGRRVRFATFMVACTLVLGACSKDSTSSSASSNSSGPAPTETMTGGANPGGDFCTQLQVEKAKLSQLGTTFGAAIASKNLPAIKQAMGTYFTAVEGAMADVEASMSSAPSDVQAALTTVNAAFTQMQTAISSATSMKDLETSMQAFGSQPQLNSASKTLSAYTKSQCGSVASP